MTVIPFPKPRGPSSKAVADFKRVCNDMGLQLRDDDAETKEALAAVAKALGIETEPLRERTDRDEV